MNIYFCFYSSTRGWLDVSDNKYSTPIADLYQKMAKANNYSWHDINDGNNEGFDFPQFNIDENGLRGDTYHSILKNAETSRNNLVVMKNAQVTKVLLDKQKRATGKYKAILIE